MTPRPSAAGPGRRDTTGIVARACDSAADRVPGTRGLECGFTDVYDLTG